jgi:ribosome biogenesis protein Nip4
MKNLKNFRVVNKTEKNIIINSLSKISTEIITILERIEYIIFISFNELGLKNNFPLIFLVPNYLSKTFDKLKSTKSIISAGIYFGFIKKNQFLLSIEGAEFLLNLNFFSERNLATVNNDGEKAILYGNQILAKMIIKISNKVKRNDFLLVFNQSNELICIARSQVNFEDIQDLKHNDIIAFNLIDKGYYLRKKQ